MSQEDQVAKAIEAITSKAATDRQFRSLILSNPHEAVKQATGIELPDYFKLQVVENDGAHYTLVLPDAAVEDEELSESELQKVVGGAAVYTHDYWYMYTKSSIQYFCDFNERVFSDVVTGNKTPIDGDSISWLTAGKKVP
ncbi:NHLP leader peptide family RiPP precursor [Cohnella panacarvi]|uniref:NHLP leader peptide family RiPP precursor n=1 Tax=Cohnella panacarvi TaxID=400776 RepID=UPI00047A9C79|nr:NHLP leader peptide family RiPP precursor [Cohnella panacarvi]